MRVYKFLTSHFAMKSLYEKRLKISKLDDLNDPFELVPFDPSNERQRRAMQRAKDEVFLGRGVLCFSAGWRDPVIWAHYVDKHRGICLGFELPEKMCKHVRSVRDRLPFPAEPLTIEHAEAMLFTKFNNWEYEEEVRAWTELKDEEDGLYYKDFDESLRLVDLIVGARSALPRVAIVRALGATTGEVTLMKARAGFGKFEVVVDQRGLV